MTRDEAAKALDGCRYREEGNYNLSLAMKAAGLVAVFGGYDDLVYFSGAVIDEISAHDGATFPFTPKGLLLNHCEDDECPYFAEILEMATPIEMLWDRAESFWTFKTVIPHTTFTVMEDDVVCCVGLVFALSDVPVRVSTST